MVTPDWYKPQPNSPWLVYKEDVIRDIQRTLSCPETGEMDENTINHIKGLQFAMNVPASGVITAETAVAIQKLRNRYAIPESGTEDGATAAV